MDSITEMKRTLRRQCRAQRREKFVPESWVHILDCQEIKKSKIVATYISYDYEPQTVDVNTALIAAGKQLLLPKLLPDKDLMWIQWDGTQKGLAQNGKIFEPIGEKFIQESEIDAVIVPALRIDRDGSRLGQGGGSYDRALARLDTSRCWKIGLVRSDELSGEKIPTDIHDQKLDAAATPELIIRFVNARFVSPRFVSPQIVPN